MLNVEQVQEIIPHRSPFLFVDRILELEPGKRILGVKNVKHDEEYFTGHFPGYPVMPGVLIIETMAQVGAVLLLHDQANRGKLAMFGGMDKVRFRRPVLPGDQLEIEVTHLTSRGEVGKVLAVARVNGDVAARAKLTYALRPRDS